MSATIDVDLSGKTCIVTGATAGIGKEIARNLARMGATVVLCCRSRERGEAAREEIARSTGTTRASIGLVDFASHGSIRAFSGDVLSKHAKLDVLVNNAGVWLPARATSPDGFELTWATNVLGYHLLTRLLLDALKSAGRARIVNVASTLAGGLDLGDLEWKKRRYDGKAAYAQTKQANRMLSWELATRLEGTGVTVNAAHPGFVRSELFREGSGLVGLAVSAAALAFAKTVEQGADTPTWLAASPECEGKTGKLWADRREIRCAFRDPGEVRALHEACERMTL